LKTVTSVGAGPSAAGWLGATPLQAANTTTISSPILTKKRIFDSPFTIGSGVQTGNKARRRSFLVKVRQPVCLKDKY
jgi:hypothetical protein